MYLFIDTRGRRRWIFTSAGHGRHVELGLGGRRDLSLANARIEATTPCEILAAADNPKVERAKEEEIPTFGESAETMSRR